MFWANELRKYSSCELYFSSFVLDSSQRENFCVQLVLKLIWYSVDYASTHIRVNAYVLCIYFIAPVLHWWHKFHPVNTGGHLCAETQWTMICGITTDEISIHSRNISFVSEVACPKYVKWLNILKYSHYKQGEKRVPEFSEFQQLWDTEWKV